MEYDDSKEDTFRAIDQDGVVLEVTDLSDGQPLFEIIDAAGTHSAMFELHRHSRQALVEALGGGTLEALDEPSYSLEIALGEVNGRASGPDPDGLGLIAERTIRALVEAQRPHSQVLANELIQAQDELGRYREQSGRDGRRIAELEAGVKLLEQQAAELSNVREALRQAGRNPADPVASIRGLRAETQSVQRRIDTACSALKAENTTLQGQIGYQREQVDAAQRALREAVEQGGEADRAAAQYISQLKATIDLERRRVAELEKERRHQDAQTSRDIAGLRELNEARIAERDRLRDALRDTLAELCDSNTGEPCASDLTYGDSVTIVARGREVIASIYGESPRAR